MTEHTSVRTWQGIECEEPPALCQDYRALLEMAERMLGARRKRFPAMVASGDLAADEAAAQIAAFEAVVADWRCILTGEGEPASILTEQSRRDALDASLRTIAALAGERGGFDTELSHQAACVIALRWHLEPGRNTSALARLSHQLRAEARDRAAGSAPEKPHVH